ncbi:hypothetical protein DFJ58DRAFT_837954 [Suillus subalutaceus]|uniref:uncharacterized protein n=1 Tax=Suillus subalutaceus TaxID=48586 RepID=UPI001B86423A|nr:uncharacterized protein DFJ58DRAFT_837954 [Suillus subalutaceus]KAG1868312.1 hypothetical protein DFJ58DRAFT_837954 [Suillus subalutaceus]
MNQVSEVFPVDFKMFKLTFPEGMKFTTKVNQKPLTLPQREFLYKWLNELEAAQYLSRCQQKVASEVSNKTTKESRIPSCTKKMPNSNLTTKICAKLQWSLPQHKQELALSIKQETGTDILGVRHQAPFQ